MESSQNVGKLSALKRAVVVNPGRLVIGRSSLVPGPLVRVPIDRESLRNELDSAERVGFEPTVATRATTVFETVPFNHSGTSPNNYGRFGKPRGRHYSRKLPAPVSTIRWIAARD